MTSEAGLVLTQAHDLAQARLLDRGLAELTLVFTETLTGVDLDAESRLYLPLAKRTVATTRARSAAVSREFYGALRLVEAPKAPPLPVVDLPPAQADELLDTSLRVTGPITTKTALASGETMGAALQTALTATLGAATRHVEGGSRDTVRLITSRDPAAGGWLRRSGGSPCSFCAMLISRGPVYRAEGTGNFRAHDHCHCKAVPFFASDSGWTAQAADFREIYDKAKADRVPFDKAYRAIYPRTVAPAGTPLAA